MAEVKVHDGGETPSQSVINDASKIEYVTDSRGPQNRPSPAEVHR